jgi:hypothetical protein
MKNLKSNYSGYYMGRQYFNAELLLSLMGKNGPNNVQDLTTSAENCSETEDPK